MSSSTRLSLHDCAVHLRIPHVLHNDPAAPSLEAHTVRAASATTRDLTECYIGSTVFLLVTVSPPAASHSADALLHALHTLGDLHVFLTESAATKPRDRSAVRLPVLRESRWVASAGVVAKGLWALVRSPPASADQDRILAMAGKHHVAVSLRERTASAATKNSPVWATIDRAGRLFAKSVALRATRPIMLAMPIQVACHAATVAGSAARIFVNVSASNVTSDAYLSVVPPYVNVGASKIISDDARDATDGVPVQLDALYDFVPMFDTAPPAKDDAISSAVDGESLSRQQSGALCEDYGLFIPSFTHWMRRAVKLGPREVYDFSYVVVRKGSQNDATEKTDGKNELAAVVAPRLQPGKCVQTCVAVAWSCSATGEADKIPESSAGALRREMSAGGVLATGERGNVAVHLTGVNWRPPSLIDGVIVTFSGPKTATVGSTVHVSISILNQNERNLEKVSVRIQQEDCDYDLLALRTVISVGTIPARAETSLQLPCMALQCGALGLGVIRVVEGDEDERTVWVSHSEYTVLVFDEDGTEGPDGHIEVTRQAIAALVAR